MERPFDPLMPYEMLLAEDARKILRQGGMEKHECSRLSLTALHDAIVDRHLQGRRDMAAVVIVNPRTASRIAEESLRVIARLRPDLPQPWKGAAASESGAREKLGGLPESMPLELIQKAVHAMFGPDVVVLKDDEFRSLNEALNAILVSVPHGRARAKENA